MSAIPKQFFEQPLPYAKEFIIAVGLMAILPNAMFWMLSFWFGIDRAIFNLDYFFVGVLFAAGWQFLATLLMILSLIADLLSQAGLLFPFVRIQDVAYLLGLLPHAAPIWQFAAGALLLLIAGVIYTIRAHGRKAKLGSALILLNVALIAYGFHVYRPAEARVDSWYRVTGKLIDSQGISFFSNRATPFIDAFTISGNPLVNIGFKGQTQRWLGAAPGTLNKKLLLIVAESWGSMKDGRVQRALLAPLSAHQQHFDWLNKGEMSASGATIGAELRELCGMDTRHYNLKPITDGFADCLPWKLKGQGYATSAIHGAGGLMYDRLYWYPRAGFDQIQFKESKDWRTHCYSFPGVCDREILDRYISHAFEGDDKKFVYWLTLNTHAIYDSRDIQEDFFNCAAYSIPEDSEVCRMTKLHAQFFHDLAAILPSESMRGVEILIVGDHPPRFLDNGELKHIKENTVAWVHFRIKG